MTRPDTVDRTLAERTLHWPAAATPVAHLMIRIFRLSALVLEGSALRIGAHGLTLKEFEVLAALRGAPPPHELAPSKIYGPALISSGGLTKVLHGLEARGLIRRGTDACDRRSKPVRLTARGRVLTERVMTEVLAADGAIIANVLSEEDAGHLTDMLRQLLAEVEARGR